MKIVKTLYKLIPVMILVSGLGACQDIVTYNDGYDDQLASSGPPQLDKVSLSTKADENIDQAAMETMVALHGNNLTGIKSVKFNDVEVDLNTIYAVRSRITLPVPRIVPKEVTNTITVTTDKGTATIPFRVNVPNLVIDGFYNEFVAVGDTAVVTGKFLDLYLLDTLNGSFTLNGNALKAIRSVEDSIYFVIPEGTPDGAVLELSSTLVESPQKIAFRNKGLSILDINTLSSYVTDGKASGDPARLPGFDKFLRIKQAFGAWSWTGFFWSGFNLNDVDIINNPKDYYVKFEINTKSTKPIGNVYWIIGGNKQESRLEPSKDIGLNTYGKWKTVRYELTELYKDAQQASGAYLVNGWNDFVFSYQPQVDVDDDFSVVNFRIVKK